MTAVDRWAEALAAWAIPQQLLDAVADSPYRWSGAVWRRRAQAAGEQGDTPTLEIVRRLVGPGGSVLDVGAGTGRNAVPLAAAGLVVTAVEPDEGMAAGLADTAAAAGVDVPVVAGRWPEVAALAGRHDVALCAHVVYDVADIGPFLSALNGAAEVGVVVELTPRHPWQGMAPYYRALHDLERPDGPTAGDLASVVAEVTGVVPHIEMWVRPGGMSFDDLDQLLDTYARRLVLPASRREELASLLAPDIVELEDGVAVGPRRRELVTLWWETSR